MNITKKFYCSDCKTWKDKPTGYAVKPSKRKSCYECCGIADKRYMDNNNKITLYLSQGENLGYSNGQYGYIYGKGWKVTNWPATLSFDVIAKKLGRHNIAGKRYDVTFRDHNNQLWYGTQYGDDTQLIHCRRYKT